jgi:hypothetical protein
MVPGSVPGGSEVLDQAQSHSQLYDGSWFPAALTTVYQLQCVERDEMMIRHGEMKRTRWKLWPNSRYYPSIRLEELKRAQHTCDRSVSLLGAGVAKQIQKQCNHDPQCNDAVPRGLVQKHSYEGIWFKSQPGYSLTCLRLQWLLSVSLHGYYDSTFKQTTSVSFHILTYSAFMFVF